MRLPSSNPITLGFGAYGEAGYTKESPHMGTDFSYQPDDVVYAPFEGHVKVIPLNGNDGNAVYMTDPQGRFHGFLHAQRFLVSNGDHVNEGQPLMVMGETGLAYGRHCHWAVKENGVFIDPMSLITEEEPMDYWNNGDTYNKLYHNLGLGIAEEAKKANYVGYFGAQNGWEYKKANEAIESSLQYGQMVQAAQSNKTVKPYDGPALFVQN